MHSCETAPAPGDAPAPPSPPPTTGPGLLLQLGRLIVRARSASPAPRRVGQVQTQPKSEPQELKPAVEAQLSDRVHALWSEQIPVCIEVLLAPDCAECFKSLSRIEAEAAYDKMHTQQRGLLLERWTMRAIVNKPHDAPAFISSQWLLNAVRSQLHFSQLSAWLARLHGERSVERRRKLSRETCNFKKLESNCDETDPANEERQLHIVFSIKIPGESYKMAEFSRPPTDHTFPVTDIGNNVFLKVVLESLPRIDDIPTVKCTCQKRRASKDIPINVHEEIVSKLNDLSIGSSRYELNINTGVCSRRLSHSSSGESGERKGDKILDDRMHTPCSENGKHRCSCDDESDVNQRSSTSFNQPKKLDERRLKEIAKYKRRLRKECKLKKLSDSTSSEGDNQKKEYTSIPILQAARFDRFRAIGCYRNQTYLTLPASRMECKTPFADSVSIPPTESKKTVSVSTQTDNSCTCGNILTMSCDSCNRGMVRSEANYNLASLNKSTKEIQDEVGTRRKYESVDESINKKLKCDLSSNIKCDNNNILNVVDDSFSNSDALKTKKDGDEDKNNIIKRPKLRRFFPIVDRIDKIVHDREMKDRAEKPKESKRQKTFSISEDDYILYEKCDYGTIDRCDVESPNDEMPSFSFPETKQENSYNFEDPNTKKHQNVFKFPDANSKNNIYKFQETDSFKSQNGAVQGGKTIHNQVPSPTEVDRFRYRFDSAASMVFSTKTGLPLTSSPAPLRRGNNCFDFDDSINGISGIKSALFHPCSPPQAAVSPPSPAPPPPAPKLRVGSSTGLLGSFEESALKGRLEPVATVHGFTAELGASGALCPPHRRLPVTVFFYAPGGTSAPYMGHINLGPGGYRVARAGTIQVSLFNPHGTLVKMFVVLYDLTCMPPMARTFLRQRTLHMPAGAEPPEPPAPLHRHKWLRYLIHLRFMTSKSGKLYLHTDIRIIVSRKADLDTATAHSAIFRPIPTNRGHAASPLTNRSEERDSANGKRANSTNDGAGGSGSTNGTPIRVFGGCSEFDSESKMPEIGYDNQNGVSYELRSFTYAPDNPKYSPR